MDERPQLTAPPPDPPELPEGAEPQPRWPVWYAPVGFIAALGFTLMALVVVGVIAAIAGADFDENTPALTIIGTLLQDAILVGTAVFFASRTLPPKPWHFGLRRTRFWPTVGWAALAMGAFYAFAASYVALFDPSGEQTVAEDLGADQSTLALVVGGIVVIVVAPIAEEFFFRGFFYRALRTRMGIAPAALLDGAVFGVIHYTGSGTLALLPVLAVLGVVFCLLYERTGSLYPVIALHALNNSIAYSQAADGSEAVSAVLGVGMIAACTLAPRFAWRRAPALG
jgi:uncharacterized protein